MLNETDNTPVAESDENLRAVYGDDATFSHIGPFTLVHLDSPSPETIVRRTSEFDPSEFFVDDCPLCQASRTQGGHIVFSDSKDDDPDDEEDGASAQERSAAVFAANPLGAPAVELVRALDRLDVASDELVGALEPIASPELLRKAVETIGFLHDRVADIMWDEDSATRLDALERIIAAALTTLEAVRAEHPALVELAGNVDASIAGVSGSLRASFEGLR